MSNHQEKVFVTGVAGFIGSQVVDQLIQMGSEVIGVDNLNDYYDTRLKQWRLEQLATSPRFEFHPMDIEDLSSLESVFSANSFDGVINLAARAGVRYSIENPHVYFTTNANGNLNLLELLRKYEIPKYVLASTSSLYAGQPMPFDESLPVNEPISPYAASKKAAEVTTFTYHQLFGIDATVVRYFTVYGPAGRPDMSVYRFIKWIDEGVPIQMFGDGTQSRDFTFVDDIARGTIAALQPVGYEIINLGGGNNPTSMNSMIGILEDCLGKKAKIDFQDPHPADMKVTWANIEKAQRLLNWKPSVSIDDGLRQCVEWYLANKSWLQDIPV